MFRNGPWENILTIENIFINNTLATIIIFCKANN
jgi:hypothetical protein